jgi:hypothetical protein
MARFASAIILVIALFTSTSAAQPSTSLGTLPQGANGHLQFSAIRAEVGFTVFVDSALVQHLVPAGIKLIRLRDAATEIRPLRATLPYTRLAEVTRLLSSFFRGLTAS